MDSISNPPQSPFVKGGGAPLFEKACPRAGGEPGLGEILFPFEKATCFMLSMVKTRLSKIQRVNN